MGVCLCLVQSAVAEETGSGPKPASSGPELVMASGISLYLSDSRTQGGYGPAVGVRYGLSPTVYVQGEVGYRLMLGNALETRLEVGIQRSRLWSPAIGLFASGLFGDKLLFLDETHPYPSRGPALAAGLSGALLRFRNAGVCVSSLELDAGLGLEDGLPALLVRLTLVELGLVW